MPRITVHEAGIRQFDGAVERMQGLLVELLAAPVAPRAEHGVIPEAAGIYLFSDRKPVYVGQTRNLRVRLRNHTAAAATEIYAALALDTVAFNSFETH